MRRTYGPNEIAYPVGDGVTWSEWFALALLIGLPIGLALLGTILWIVGALW